MLIRILLVAVVLCAVISSIECERGYCAHCRFIPYKRIKRGKYYSYPPKRFYSRPPVRFPYVGGVISYTPPPNYVADNDQPYPGPPSGYKVSKRPNDGLGDDDINNLMKHLTQQDLDKIVEFANEKQRAERPYPNAVENFSNEYRYPKKREETTVYQANDEDFGTFEQIEKQLSHQIEDTKFKEDPHPIEKEQKYTFNGPYINQRPYEFNNEQQFYNDPSTEEPANYVVQASKTYEIKDTRESGPQQNYNNIALNPQQNYVTVMKDIDQVNDYANEVGETLPRPLNMRPEEYDAMFTNNVPQVVKANESGYKVENFGDLPLMNYNSKLDTVSSYHVPHYTITTPNRNQAAASSGSSTYSAPSPASASLKPAPLLSAAKEQSDAHLKAVKIWSHRSKGTAYTLHSDGTLSLEKPSASKSYGG